MQTQDTTHQAIVFYDGECMLCAKTVGFLLKADRYNKLKFAPLGGVTSRNLDIQNDSAEINSVVFFNNGVTYHYSTAVLNILKVLPFPWPIFYLFVVIPSFIRDGIYRYIGRNRYRWFGKTTCLFYHPKYTEKILD